MENISQALLTNIEATHKMIGACSKNGIPLLITSTSEVYGVSEDKKFRTNNWCVFNSKFELVHQTSNEI